MEQVLLHIELTGRKMSGTDQDEMRFQQKGDPRLWAQMVRTVMQHNQEIAASFMAAVIDYCHEEGIDCGDLSSMVIFGERGPLNNRKKG